jgi:AcrR family transcriptional regulator
VPKISTSARDERRRRLIDAAWRVAASRGYRNWTVEDVCSEAGVSKGSFYGYFASKEALLVALLEADAAEVEALIARLSRDGVAVVAGLREFVRGMLRMREDPGRAQVRADLLAETLTNDEMRQRFVATVQRRRKLLQAWIEDGVSGGQIIDVPPRALASVVLALADGLTLHNAVDPGAFSWANVRRAVDELLGRLSG